MIEIFVS